MSQSPAWIIQVCAAAGEQARLLPRVPMKLKLADQTTAALPLTPSGTAAALVIRAPVILAALREYFEMLWDPSYRPAAVTGIAPTMLILAAELRLASGWALARQRRITA